MVHSCPLKLDLTLRLSIALSSCVFNANRSDRSLAKQMPHSFVMNIAPTRCLLVAVSSHFSRTHV